MSARSNSSLYFDPSDSGSPGSLGNLVVRKADNPHSKTPYHVHVSSSAVDSEDSPTSESTSDGQSSDSSSSPVVFSPALAVPADKSTSGTQPSRVRADSQSSANTIPNHDSKDGSPTTAIPSEDLYSLAGLPVLEDSIPAENLPDELIVHDPHDLPYPVRYVRVNPVTKYSRQFAFPVRDPRDAVPPRRVAQLHLENDNHIGNGAHSTVFRAPLTLPLAAGSEVATRVRVVAKTPAPDCGSHRQLHQEARMYHSFPRTLYEQHKQQEYVAKPVPVPTAAADAVISDGASALSSSQSSDEPSIRVGGGRRKLSWREQFKLKRPVLKLTGKKSSTTAAGSEASLARAPRSVAQGGIVRELTTTDVAPVVPKFYGYYLLLKPDGTIYFDTHDECDEDGTCEVAWPPAMLLIEDCGSPIQPALFSDAQRWECHRLLESLHAAGFIMRQPAMTTDKMLAQPGLLTAPRAERSLATPSFRLVDFGRGFARSISKPEGFEEFWQEWCDHGSDGAFEALQLDHTS
ncbi:hypothetical protein BD310DRAFT_820528 [Dichomitus squalens]|uniref:Uncharacterized protein n=1 Tax=Dichomitus squalens TaxID=114155 RepID=A0A4Q9PU07_9APHY|nr:hypothetical protein BD310DRAFT_820528 [Dichomitus squalens]